MTDRVRTKLVEHVEQNDCASPEAPGAIQLEVEELEERIAPATMVEYTMIIVGILMAAGAYVLGHCSEVACR
jgi:hypothetical protein